MLVREKMILTIFKVPLALRAEPELQGRVIHFRPSADCAFMLGNTCRILRM